MSKDRICPQCGSTNVKCFEPDLVLQGGCGCMDCGGSWEKPVDEKNDDPPEILPITYITDDEIPF
jgi:hypothetical protein